MRRPALQAGRKGPGCPVPAILPGSQAPCLTLRSQLGEPGKAKNQPFSCDKWMRPWRGVVRRDQQKSMGWDSLRWLRGGPPGDSAVASGLISKTVFEGGLEGAGGAVRADHRVVSSGVTRPRRSACSVACWRMSGGRGAAAQSRRVRARLVTGTLPTHFRSATGMSA